MNVTKLRTEPEKCVGCLMCQLRCSLTYEGVYSPLKARVVIDPPIAGGRGISFTEECTECNLCVEVCAYSAITAAGEES